MDWSKLESKQKDVIRSRWLNEHPDYVEAIRVWKESRDLIDEPPPWDVDVRTYLKNVLTHKDRCIAKYKEAEKAKADCAARLLKEYDDAVKQHFDTSDG